MSNLSPKERAERTRISFERKVELLEMWARDGMPKGQYWPKGELELRNWDDPILGVRAWKSPNVGSPSGRYRELRYRFDDAIETLKRQQTQTKDSESRLRIRIAQLERQNLALAEQVAQHREQIASLERKLARKQARLDAAVNAGAS